MQPKLCLLSKIFIAHIWSRIRTCVRFTPMSCGTFMHRTSLYSVASFYGVTTEAGLKIWLGWIQCIWLPKTGPQIWITVTVKPKLMTVYLSEFLWVNTMLITQLNAVETLYYRGATAGTRGHGSRKKWLSRLNNKQATMHSTLTIVTFSPELAANNFSTAPPSMLPLNTMKAL